jgi:class 3 adenylate cyclase
LSNLLGLTQREYIQLQDKVRAVCCHSLDEAEAEWEYTEAGKKLVEKAVALEEAANTRFVVQDNALESDIPGHKLVDKAKITELIALVCDIRKSTQRLSTTLAYTKVNGIQRVFYETSALLPSLEVVIDHFNGAVTEYLGDGILGFFPYLNTDDLYNSYYASIGCMEIVRPIVNKEISDRYNLPPLDIGIGMACGPAMVRKVAQKHVKAFGRCVWTASKLSSETNMILVDDQLKAKWPSSKGGRISFRRIERVRGEVGYKLHPQ